jgi:hypothetical protein
VPDGLGRVALFFTVVGNDFKKIPFCGKILFEFGIEEVWKNRREIGEDYPYATIAVSNISRGGDPYYARTGFYEERRPSDVL